MLFNVADTGVLLHKKAVYAVVLGFLHSAVMDAAARDNRHIRALPDIKIVVNDLGKPALTDNNGDMDALVFGAGPNDDINSGLVRLGDDIDMLRRRAAGRIPICANVVSAGRNAVQICDFPEQIFLNFVDHDVSPFSFRLIRFFPTVFDMRHRKSRAAPAGFPPLFRFCRAVRPQSQGFYRRYSKSVPDAI